MKWPRAGVISGSLVALLFGFALYLRTELAYSQIFTGEWIKFAGVDAYYHLRLVDNLVRNFPFLSQFDPYLIYPGGQPLSGAQFFNWLLAGIIWVVTMGSPDPQTVDIVSAYFPAVLGALVVIPVYFTGKELFGRWAGVLAAAVLVVLPGEFLGRSIIGFTDYHVAEVLFTTAALWFLIIAIKTARRNQLSLGDFRNRDRKTARPAIYAVVAGGWLGIYFLTWQGALLFAFLITVYVIIQFTIDHMMRRSPDYLLVVGLCLLTTTVIAIPPLWTEKLQSVALLTAALTVPALMTISRLMLRKGLRPGYYPLALAVLALAGIIVLHLGAPWLLKGILERVSFFIPSSVAQTTMEAQPLLLPLGKFSLDVVWGNFGVTIYLAIIAMGILTYLVIRHAEADKTLLLVWSLVMVAASLGQRRFAYYLAVNVALLSGYVCWLILKLANSGGRKALPIEETPVPKRRKTVLRRKHDSGLSPAVRYINISLAGIIIFFFIFFINFEPTIITAGQARFAPTDAWMKSLTWMRENTPEPFGDPNFYYQRSLKPSGEYKYPGSAYGVLSWWDYGYWITRIAHRMPTTNPGQDPAPIVSISSFLLSQYEGLAAGMIQKTESGYLILDHTMTTTKLWAIARWGGMEDYQFYDVYYQAQGNRLVPVAFFYPAYYRTMGVRLYNFDGKAVPATNTLVISFEQRVSQERMPYKQIISSQTFANWQDAVAYVARQKTPNYRIVGNDPFVSPVPLEQLQDYRLVHTDGNVQISGSEHLSPEIKIFQYVGEKKIKPPATQP